MNNSFHHNIFQLFYIKLIIIFTILIQSYCLQLQTLLLTKSLSKYSNFNLKINFQISQHQYNELANLSFISFPTSVYSIVLQTYNKSSIRNNTVPQSQIQILENYNISFHQLSFNDFRKKKQTINLEVYNFQSSSMEINAKMVFYYNKIQLIRSLTQSQQLTTQYIQAQEIAVLNYINSKLLQFTFIQLQEVSSLQSNFKHNYFSIIQKQKTQNYMLPFNLLSLKKKKVFVDRLNLHKYSQLTSQNYQNEPFLPTFWNELKNQIIMIPWIPYFSQCTQIDKRILIQDVVIPQECTETQWQSLKTSFDKIRCKDKMLNFSCIIEEQNVINVQRMEWFHNYAQNILYFYSQAVQSNRIYNYLKDFDTIDYVSKSIYNQIPIYYKSNININQIPKQFIYQFYISIDDNLIPTIVDVQLTANDYYSISLQSSQTTTQNKQTKLHISVNYLNDYEQIYYLTFDKLLYYLFVPIFLVLFVLLILFFMKRQIKIFQTQKLVYLIIGPMIKGLILCLSTAFGFTLMFYYISQYTNFQLFATTFNGDDTIKLDLYKKYNGRNGLILIITGLFILISSIKQSFKIPSPQQMRITIQDDQEQNLRQNVFHKARNQQTQRDFRKKQISQEDIGFSIKNLQSRRNRFLVYFLFILLIIYYNYKMAAYKNVWYIEILKLSVFPIILNIGYKINCYQIFRDLLFTIATAIISQAYYFCIVILKSQTIIQFISVIVGYVFIYNILFPMAQIKFHKYCSRVYNQKTPNIFQVLILKNFKNFLKTQTNYSQYQKGLYFSSIFLSYICSLIIIPFVFILLQLTFEQSKIFEDIYINYQRFQIISFMTILTLPLLIYCSLLIMQKFDKHYNLRFIPLLQLNQFQFRNRKVKWISDVFRQNSTIYDYLRQFQKFHFSSQLYIILFLLTLSGINLLIGLRILYANNYICFVDPAMIFIFIIVWIIGDIFSMILSYLALKFKFYQKKEQSRMRTKLQSMEKFLKKNQYQKYLVLDQVKEYFLFTYKNWIVKNVQKILTKNMFQQDNGILLKKFKFYKNLLKRKSLMKRNSISLNQNILFPNVDRIKGSNNMTISANMNINNNNNQLNLLQNVRNQDNYMNLSVTNPINSQNNPLKSSVRTSKSNQKYNINNLKNINFEQNKKRSIINTNNNDRQFIQRQDQIQIMDQFQNKQQRKQTGSRNKKKQNSYIPIKINQEQRKKTIQQRKANRYQQWKQARVIKISKRHFTQYAKPLLYYWFYTAKQNTLIKSLIERVKHQSLHPNSLCEFCNMDLDIQLIQKHDIEQIINKYRVINVGLPFIRQNFIEFYRSRQQFIIVCYQCKQKKLYLQKKKIKNIRVAKIIMMNWYIRCKSRMLHNIGKQSNKQRKNNGYASLNNEQIKKQNNNINIKRNYNQRQNKTIMKTIKTKPQEYQID